MSQEVLKLASELVKRFEGCRLQAYLCPAGIPTIGWGETKNVRMGDTWTQWQADTALYARLKEFMAGVLKACPQLSSEPAHRLAACISLAYNIGLAAFAKSTVCRKISSKQYSEAADAFCLWNKTGGNVLKGLVIRREAERAMFIGEGQ